MEKKSPRSASLPSKNIFIFIDIFLLLKSLICLVMFNSGMMSPIEKNLDFSQVLDNVSIVTNSLRKKCNSSEVRVRMLEDNIIKLQVENDFYSKKALNYDEISKKLNLAQTEICRLNSKIDKANSYKSKLEEEFKQDFLLLERTASILEKKNQALDKQTQEFKNLEDYYKQKLKCNENLILNHEKTIIDVAEKFKDLENQIKNNLVDKIVFNRLEDSYKSLFINVNVYNLLKSKYESLSQEIKNNFVSKDVFDRLKIEHENLVINRNLEQESLNILLEEKKINFEKLKEAEEKFVSLEMKYSSMVKELEITKHLNSKYDSQLKESSKIMENIGAISNEYVIPGNTIEETVVYHDYNVKDLLNSNKEIRNVNSNMLLQSAHIGKLKTILRQEINYRGKFASDYLVLQKQLDEFRTSYDMLKQDSQISLQKLKDDYDAIILELSEKDNELLEWKTNCLELEKKIFNLENQITNIKMKNKKKEEKTLGQTMI